VLGCADLDVARARFGDGVRRGHPVARRAVLDFEAGAVVTLTTSFDV